MPRTVLIAGLLAVLLAAPAQAQDNRSKILSQCQDGALTGDFSIREIRDARNNIPDDVDQYSDCRDVLSRALAARTGGSGGGDAGGVGGAGGGGGGAGGGSAGLTPATDEDRAAIEEAAAGGAAAVDVGGRPVVPGLAADTSRNPLPDTLIVVLALLAAAALVALAPFVRRRGLTPLLRLLPGRSA